MWGLWEEKPAWVRAWENLPDRERLKLLRHYANEKNAEGLDTMVLSRKDNFGHLPPNLRVVLWSVFGGLFFVSPDGMTRTPTPRRQ